MSYTRRVLEIVNTMVRLGWNRRRAVRFAIAKIKRNPQAPVSKPKRRREMSGELKEYLRHSRRSTSRGMTLSL